MPVLTICNSCLAEYQLKDEYGGKRVRCKDCGAVILVPQAEVTEAWLPPDEVRDNPFEHDRFLINQKKVSISEKYYVFDDRQNPILYIERPAHFLQGVLAVLAGLTVVVAGLGLASIPLLVLDKPETRWIGGLVFLAGLPLTLIAGIALIIRLTPKRHISIYTDDTRSHLLLEVLQDRKLDLIWATYTVHDPEDGTLGQFRKNHLSNLFRKRWDGFGPDGVRMVVAREDSLILSLLRRFLGPMFGLLRTNFIIQRPHSETIIGEFNRKATLFDRYVLDMTSDRAYEFDRRMAVALGILLDTGEHR